MIEAGIWFPKAFCEVILANAWCPIDDSVHLGDYDERAESCRLNECGIARVCRSIQEIWRKEMWPDKPHDRTINPGPTDTINKGANEIGQPEPGREMRLLTDWMPKDEAITLQIELQGAGFYDFRREKRDAS